MYLQHYNTVIVRRRPNKCAFEDSHHVRYVDCSTGYKVGVVTFYVPSQRKTSHTERFLLL